MKAIKHALYVRVHHYMAHGVLAQGGGQPGQPGWRLGWFCYRRVDEEEDRCGSGPIVSGRSAQGLFDYFILWMICLTISSLLREVTVFRRPSFL